MDENVKKTKEEKILEIENVLKSIENGTLETYEELNGTSDVWDRFLKIRESTSRKLIEYAQCVECKILLSYKGTGSSHLSRHKCRERRRDNNEVQNFRSIPPDQVEKTQSLLAKNAIKYCAKALVPVQALSESSEFLDYAQTFVLFGHKKGHADLKKIFPNSTVLRRGIGNVKDEKLQEIYKQFREAMKVDWCSSTFATSRYINNGIHQELLTMRIQYFEKDLSGLKKKIIFSSVLDDNDLENEKSLFLNVVKNFNAFGGDSQDLQRMQVVTSKTGILSSTFNIYSKSRRNCITEIIINILNKAFEMSTTTETEDLLSNCRSLVKFFTASETYNITLSLDTGTWTSKISMLQSVTKNYDEIIKILNDENQYKFNINKIRTKELIKFLLPFVAAIDELSSTTITTANKILLWWKILSDHLGKFGDYSFEIKNLMINAKICFESEFVVTTENKINCFLDPRYKLLSMLDDDDKLEVMVEIRKLLADNDNDDDIEEPEPSESDYVPNGKKSRFAIFEKKKPNSKPKSKKPEVENRFAKYETKNPKIADEVDSYLKLPQVISEDFEEEFHIISKFWKSNETKLPKLFKLVVSRLHVPASCGCDGNGNVILKHNLTPETLSDLLFVRDNLSEIS